MISWVVLIDPSLDLWKPLVLLADVVAFGQVDEVGDGLGRKEGERVDGLDLASQLVLGGQDKDRKKG